MMKNTTVVALFLVLAGFGCSSGNSDPTTGSESHGISCETSEDCSGDHRCINNRCTLDDAGSVSENDTGEPSWRLTIEDAHRSCTEDSECVRIHPVDCGACKCDAVHRDHTDKYTRDQLECSGYSGGECDPDCGFFPADIPLCESELCQLYRPDLSNTDDWTLTPVSAEYQVAFPFIYEGPGFAEDGESTSFLMRLRDDGERWHFETGPDSSEPAEFEELPDTFQYSQRYELEVDGPLSVVIYYQDDFAVEEQYPGRIVVFVGPTAGPFREVMHIKYFDSRFAIEKVLETIAVR